MIKDLLPNSQSQAHQDIFAYLVCNTNDGYFIDIGSGPPISVNNTYLLESLGWKGLSFDKDDHSPYYLNERKTPIIIGDVTKLNINAILDIEQSPKVIDYLSIDVDDATEQFIFQNFPKDYKFKCITFEHNLYVGDELKNKSKKFFLDKGYTLLCENVAVAFSSDRDMFEDWYINEEFINIERVEFLRSNGLLHTEIIEKMKKNEIIKDNMKICLYTMVINEEEFLPFFLDYYTNYVGVNKIVIYDGGSTDRSHEIINSYSNTVIVYENDDKTDSFRDLRIWNEEWKKERNDFDWMIVCTPDEFLYHPEIRTKLWELKQKGITVPMVEGFDMISMEHPSYDRGNYLPKQIKRGIKDPSFLNKNIVFSSKDVDINYHVGCHGCNPTGNVVYSDTFEFKLLHYKWISHNFLLRDAKKKFERLSNKMLETGAGFHYKTFKETTIDEYITRYNQSQTVVTEQLSKELKTWFENDEVHFLANADFNQVDVLIRSTHNDVCYKGSFDIKSNINYWIKPNDKSYLMGCYIILTKENKEIYRTNYFFRDDFVAEYNTDQFIRENYFPDYSYKGTMVEIGAGPPIMYSMSKHFRDNGWRCICVEPNPKFIEQHKALSHEIYPYACSYKNGTTDFHIIETGIWNNDFEGLSWSAINLIYEPSDNATVTVISVPSKTLDAILEEAGVEHVDFVSIDTEGWELEVMFGFNVNKYSPKVILLENVNHLNIYEHYMESCGYILEKKLEYNYIFTRNKKHYNFIQDLVNIRNKDNGLSETIEEQWVKLVEKNITNFNYDKTFKFSFLIPTYKRYFPLQRAINSVLKQKYENIEILVCSDGEDQKVLDIVNTYKDKRIKYLFTERTNNSGTSQRNYMSEKSLGDFIIFLDDDNYLYDNYMETILHNIEDETDMLVYKIDIDGHIYPTIPIEHSLEHRKIDTLNFVINKRFLNIKWTNLYMHDFIHFKTIEYLILKENRKIKYIDNVIARHSTV